MKLLTVSNLYPRPDQPHRGLFNAQLFKAFSETETVANICLVPEWRVWRWAGIRAWECPVSGPGTRYEPVFYLPAVGRSFSHRTYAASMARVGRFAADADVTYVSWAYPDGAAVARVIPPDALLWLMVLGSDTFHLDHAGRRSVLVDTCARAEGVVCVCRDLAQRMVRAGVAKAKVHVAPNGVDPVKFHPLPREEALDGLRRSGGLANLLIDEASPLVLFVGNLVPVKGPDTMLRAWAEFSHSQTPMPRCSHAPILLFLGDGPMRGELDRMARELGVAGTVRFAGSCPHDELPLWMNVAAGLCLTSRSEGMPNVVLEALAVGLPVVATDVGACREMLSGKETARIVPEGDTMSVASALDEVLRIRPDTARRSSKCRSWRDQAREILGLMAESG